MQVCPTGALFNKGATVAEMEKQHDFLRWILDGRERRVELQSERRDSQGQEQREGQIMKLEPKIRLATVWLGGCSGCHMSFLDLDERLIDLAEVVDLVYSPIADIKEFPENVDVTLVEGAVANIDHLKLAHRHPGAAARWWSALATAP